MVSSFLPYPIFSGGHIRLFNILKLLSKKHQIYLVCEKRDYQTKNDVKAVEEYCEKVITVNREKQWSWQNIVKTGLSSKSFLITGHASNKMKKEIDDLLNQEKFDLIHIETFYVMQNLPKTALPTVLIEHNVEYLVYKRFAKQAPLFLRPLLYIDILKLKFWEENMWNKATKLVAVSEIDKKIMEKKRRDVDVVSNGVDIEKFRFMNYESRIQNEEKRMLFIGDFRWIENRDAAEWILKEIWPKLNHESRIMNHGLKLWIVGKNIPQSLKKLSNDDNVIFDENAPDKTEIIYQKSNILLAPIRVGGGTSFKILEAMASGICVVTTALGNAIKAEENLEILVANNSDGFVEKIRELLENEKFYKKISTNARKLVEKKFNWKKITRDLNSVYESVVPYD